MSAQDDVPRGGRCWSGLRLHGALSLLLAGGVTACVVETTSEMDGDPPGVEVASDDPRYESLLRLGAEREADRELAPFRDALAHRRAGRDGDALEVLGDIAGEDHLSDWARVLEAEIHARRGDLSRVEAALADMPPDLRDVRGWRQLVDALVASGRPDSAMAVAESALEAAWTPADSAEAFVRLASAALAMDRKDVARHAVLGALALRPVPASAGKAVALVPALGSLSSAQRRDVVRFHLARGMLADAESELQRMVEASAADADEVRGARLEVAEVLLARGRLEQADSLAMTVVGRPGPAGVVARAWVLAGRTSLRRERRSEAMSRFARATVAQPRGAASQEAHFILADLDHDAGRNDRARTGFRQAFEVAPETEWGGEAAMRLGTMLFADGDFPAAASVFEEYRLAHPEGWRYQQAVFWGGLSYRQMGEVKRSVRYLREATRAGPFGYYGMRAARVGGGHGIASPEHPGPEATREDSIFARGGLVRSRDLREVGLLDAADAEERRLRLFLGRRPGGLHALGEALLDEGRIVEGVLTGREARRAAGRWDARALRIVYPLPFQEAILRGADRWEVDPFLVAALVRRESLFQPHAESLAGAVGLMQLLPRTARSLAPRAGVGRVDGDVLRDPDVNLTLGILHLGDLLRAHGGRVDDVLMAYNAGDGRLVRWRELPEYGDPDLFLERIPYRETREYVRSVREAEMVYSVLYGDGGPEASTEGR